jgi:hypothetical protein
MAQDYLGPALLSHFILHGKIVEETVKQLLTQIKKYSKLEDLSHIYLDAMKRVLFLLDDLLCSFMGAGTADFSISCGSIKRSLFLLLTQGGCASLLTKKSV